ncbi:hypothetical protein [Halobacillus litoralis]|uniref:hypothetical protein n=1 Tax=Halobacillus litoralis TaxID=45668 RepID=UPI001CFDF8FF|nr:hypothetical protein [Halobacillus litoralis]
MRTYILEELCRVKGEILCNERQKGEGAHFTRQRLKGMDEAYRNLFLIESRNMVAYSDVSDKDKYIDDAIAKHIQGGFRTGDRAIDGKLIGRYIIEWQLENGAIKWAE